MATVFVEIRMLKDIPAVIGTDMNTYGPFFKDRVYAIPKENARLFIKQGVAVATRKEAEKPTLKEMFKGEVLTPYVEASLVKPLVEPSVNVNDLEDYFYNRLFAEGLKPPRKADAPTNSWWLAFDAKIDTKLSMEENERNLDALVEMIVDQEKRKEGMVTRERRQALLKRSEDLIKDIQETRKT